MGDIIGSYDPARYAIDNLFGKITPLPENTTIPTTMTSEEIKERKGQPYDGTRPQIMTKKQKEAYNNMLNKKNEEGTQAIENLMNFIATGRTSSLVEYDTNTDAIPKAPRDVVPLSTIKSVIGYIEILDNIDEITDLVKDFTEYNMENNLILTERFKKQLDSLLEAKYAEINQSPISN